MNEGKKRLVMVEVQEEMVDKLLMFRGKLSRSQVGASQFSSANVLKCRAKAAATHRTTSIGRRHCLVTALKLFKYAELPQYLQFLSAFFK